MQNIEISYILNKETILIGDFNIDFLDKEPYKKHRFVKGIAGMNLNQFVNEITRPVSVISLIIFSPTVPREFLRRLPMI